jgi:cyclophilin family peptidyl-prolyl cis-trans isomerase
MTKLRLIATIGACIAGTVLAAPAVRAQDTPTPRVVIETSKGDILVQLDREHTPKTVENFLRYVKEGHYDGTVFYRVVPGFIIQAGSYDAEGKPRGVYDPVPLETATAQSNLRGTITMAHGDEPDSGRAEFFINLADNKALDRKPEDMDNKTGFAAFGRVIEGMGVVNAISMVPAMGGVGPFPDAAPMMPVTINKITILNN